MRIHILAIGNKMPAWVEHGFREYSKRFPPSCTLALTEVPAEKRAKLYNAPQLMKRESDKLLTYSKPGNRIIALDRQGKYWSTTQLSAQLAEWQQDGRPIDFLIGGPDGLTDDCLQKTEFTWSLSPLTLPHPLVRIILAEQLYRALSILQNHPYHR